MPELLYKPVPGASALVDPARIIPALPPGILIIPKKRLPVGRIVLLVLVALGGLTWLQIWTSHNRREAADAAAAKQIANQSESGAKHSATQSKAGTRRIRSQAGATRSEAGITPGESESGRSPADKAKIKQITTLAILTHRPKGSLIQVPLSNGVRIFQIQSSIVHRQPGKPPTTCVLFGVVDPATGAKDSPETVCYAGLDDPIQ